MNAAGEQDPEAFSRLETASTEAEDALRNIKEEWTSMKKEW